MKKQFAVDVTPAHEKLVAALHSLAEQQGLAGGNSYSITCGVRRLPGGTVYLERIDIMNDGNPPVAGTWPPAYPDAMTDDLREILGLPNFVCSPYAALFRDAGVAEIKRQAEAEQAFVIDLLLRLYLKHGAAWRAFFAAKMQSALEAIKTQQAIDAARGAEG